MIKVTSEEFMYKNDDIEVPESVSYELSDTDKSNCEKAIAFMDANEFVESIRMGWYGSLEVEGDLSIDDVSLIVYRSGSIYIVITENYSGYDLEICVRLRQQGTGVDRSLSSIF